MVINSMFFSLFKNLFKKHYSEVTPNIRIHQLDRDVFEVKIHERVAIIYAELIGGEYTRDIDPLSVNHWSSPHDDELFSESDRNDVVNALKLFFDKSGQSYYPLITEGGIIRRYCVQ